MARFFLFFFFQAEDGIRDYKVTGVQTCALPIYPRLDRVLTMADGSVPVGDVAQRLGISDDRGRRELTRLLRYLWWNNALTWLPPSSPGALRSASGSAG